MSISTERGVKSRVPLLPDFPLLRWGSLRERGADLADIGGRLYIFRRNGSIALVHPAFELPPRRVVLAIWFRRLGFSADWWSGQRSGYAQTDPPGIAAPTNFLSCGPG